MAKKTFPIKKTLVGIITAGTLYFGVQITTGIYQGIQSINSLISKPAIEKIENKEEVQDSKISKKTRKSLYYLANAKLLDYETYGKEINIRDFLREIIWKQGYYFLDDSTINNETLNHPFEIVEDPDVDDDTDIGDDCLTQCIYIETDDDVLRYAKIDVPTGTEFTLRTCYKNNFPVQRCEIISYKLDQTVLILSINSENNLMVDSDGFKLTKLNQSGLEPEEYLTVHNDTISFWEKQK